MKRIAIGLLLVAGLLAAVLFGTNGHAGTQGDRVFHVDYENGDDSRSGLSLALAWKHAPGDPAAGGAALETRLQAGDRVVFAAGVTYRGTIAVRAEGTADKPIVFEGAPGGRAVIDGSDPADTRRCTSAQMCGGAANWQQLVLVSAATPLGDHAALFTPAGSLRPAQTPDPQSDFYRHEPADMVEVDGRQLEQGRVDLPRSLHAGIAPGASLALWVKPNLVKERPITRIEGTSVFFDRTDLEFYDDRPSRIAIVNSLPALDRPGEYVVLPGGRSAVAMLPQGAETVSIATGRGGFDLTRAAYVTIRNLSFANMTDGGRQFGGIAIFSNMRNNRGIAIEGNSFRHMVMPVGQGPIILRGVNDVVVRDNLIEDVVLGSGMRITRPSSGILVSGNTIRRIGRTGIMIMGATDALVTHNLIEDARGVHGNGISAYQQNRNVRFVENTVLDAERPVTFHASTSDKAGEPALSFVRNILIASDGGTASLINWGGSAKDVAIVGNILLGGRYGLRMNASDGRVVIDRNFGLAPSILGGQPRGWNIGANRWTRPSSRIQQAWAQAAGGGAPLAGELRDMAAFLCGAEEGREPTVQPLRLGAGTAC